MRSEICLQNLEPSCGPPVRLMHRARRKPLPYEPTTSCSELSQLVGEVVRHDLCTTNLRSPSDILSHRMAAASNDVLPCIQSEPHNCHLAKVTLLQVRGSTSFASVVQHWFVLRFCRPTLSHLTMTTFHHPLPSYLQIQYIYPQPNMFDWQTTVLQAASITISQIRRPAASSQSGLMA